MHVKYLNCKGQHYDEYEKYFRKSTAMKAIINQKVIGSVRAEVINDSCHITRLIVHPDFQKNGIGSKLMIEIEKSFMGSVKRFELCTGERSYSSQSLYKNLGYTIFKRTDGHEIPLVFMEKHLVDEDQLTFIVANFKDKEQVSAIQNLVQEYFEWGNGISVEKHGFNFDIMGMLNEFISDLASYSAPDGILYLISCHSEFIGLGGFKRHSEHSCELKRIYVRENYREKGFGRHLLSLLIEKAQVYGYEEMVLESARYMTSGYNLYQSFGFEEIELYDGAQTPVEYRSIIYCMKKRLKPI